MGRGEYVCCVTKKQKQRFHYQPTFMQYASASRKQETTEKFTRIPVNCFLNNSTDKKSLEDGTDGRGGRNGLDGRDGRDGRGETEQNGTDATDGTDGTGRNGTDEQSLYPTLVHFDGICIARL